MIYTTTQCEDIKKSFLFILLHFVHRVLTGLKYTKHRNDTNTVLYTPFNT